jgi:uncharacterized membrane protein
MASANPAVRQHVHRHPVNVAHLEDAPLSARIADRVVAFIGSWVFILIQTVIVVIWVLGNVYLVFNFDPFPFILLNLAFSTQAAYAAPLILLAGNRQATRDRLTLEHAAEETDVAEQQNKQLLDGNTEILKRIENLEKLILELQKKTLERMPTDG